MEIDANLLDFLGDSSTLVVRIYSPNGNYWFPNVVLWLTVRSYRTELRYPRNLAVGGRGFELWPLKAPKGLNLQYFQPHRLTSMPMDAACFCTQKGQTWLWHMVFTVSGFLPA